MAIPDTDFQTETPSSRQTEAAFEDPPGMPFRMQVDPLPYTDQWWQQFEQPQLPEGPGPSQRFQLAGPAEAAAQAGAGAAAAAPQGADAVVAQLQGGAVPFRGAGGFDFGPPAPSTEAPTGPGAVPFRTPAQEMETPEPIFQTWDDKTPSNKAIEQAQANATQEKKQVVGSQLRDLSPMRARHPALPSMAQRPQTPETIMRGTLAAFTNPLMLMAIGFGAMTKRPALNALTAATGVLTGLNERDYKNARLNQQKFRNSVKETDRQAHLQQADYDAIFNSDMSTEDKLAHLRASADAHQDDSMLLTLREGIDKAQQLQEERRKILPSLGHARRGWDKSVARLHEQAGEERVQAIADYRAPPDEKNAELMRKVRKLNPDYDVAEWERRKGEARRKPAAEGGAKPLTPAAAERAEKLGAELTPENLKDIYEGKQPTKDPRVHQAVRDWVAEQNRDRPEGEKLPPYDPSQYERTTPIGQARLARAQTQQQQLQAVQSGELEPTAQAYAKGDRSVARGLPPVARAWVMRRAGQINPDMATAGLRYNATARELLTEANVEGRTKAALEKALMTAPVVRELSKKVNRTNFPDINSVLLAARQRTGDQDVIAFGIGVETLLTNYALAIGGGVASGITEGAAKRAHTLLQLNYSKGQTERAVNQMIFELNRELAGASAAVDNTLKRFKTQDMTGIALSNEDERALDWATKNSGDPRANEILRKIYGL